VHLAAEKLRAELTIQSVSSGATKLADMLKLTISRGVQYASMRNDMMNNKMKFRLQLAEMQVKLTGTTNQMVMSDTINAEKAEYATKLTTLRWDADNMKYRFEAFAALHGGLTTGKKTEESGWNAMDGFQKATAVASVAVSLGQGIAALGKDLNWGQSADSNWLTKSIWGK
jgi:hypothetical protein